MNNLTTNQKKQILSQLITNKVNENKSIVEFMGINLDSVNYAQIVANMLINNSKLSSEIIDLLDPNNPFSKKVRAIQYA
tara:strand:+ start:194 stop:430 length:237 start_codon:yes stop_codon:yes gene_type:complete